MADTGAKIGSSSIAYHYKLRTVTAPGGRAVLLSEAEMAVFSALARTYPRPVRLQGIRPGRRHVLVYRLRVKLRRIECDVSFNGNGYVLSGI